MPENIDYTPHDSVVVNAVMCREVIEEKNGLITPLKLFENVEYPVGTKDLAEFYIVCVMKCFNSTQLDHVMDVFLTNSKGVREVLLSAFPVKFGNKIPDDSPPGVFHVLQAGIKIPGPGSYWLEIWMDGKFCTRVQIFFKPSGESHA